MQRKKASITSRNTGDLITLNSFALTSSSTFLIPDPSAEKLSCFLFHWSWVQPLSSTEIVLIKSHLTVQAVQFFFDIAKIFLKHRKNKQNVSLDVHYKDIKMILMRLVLASSFNFQITLLRYNSHSAKYIFLKYRSQLL